MAIKAWAIASWHICFLLAVFLILAKYSVPLFHRTEHITYIFLMLLSCGFLSQNILMVSPEKKISILDL
jgi:hypothetical protein